MMFILTPALQPNAGGVQMSTTKLGRYFAGIGHEVAVFSFATEGHAPCDFGDLQIAEEAGGSESPRNLDKMRLGLAQFRPDIVINQMPYEHSIGEVLLANKKFLLLGCLRNTLFSVKGDLDGYIRRSVSQSLHSLALNSVGRAVFLARHRRRHRADLERILETYDRFIMFGPPNLEELEWFIPDFDRDKVHLIPNSIPSVEPIVPLKEKRLLWLGRVAREQKQAELILPVWSALSAALPDWSLDVVGDGPLLETLQKQASQQGLERIEFHGRQVPDDFYRRAAIFFMTSAFEGFPNTLVEAQSYGAIPVIFDSYPVARWIVEDGVNGVLVPPFEVGAMVRSIVELAERADRDRIANGALESARRFHIDRVGELWQELFESELPQQMPGSIEHAGGGRD